MLIDILGNPKFCSLFVTPFPHPLENYSNFHAKNKNIGTHASEFIIRSRNVIEVLNTHESPFVSTMDVEDTKSVVHDDSVSSGCTKTPQTSLVQNTPNSTISVKMLIDNWFTMYYYYLHWKYFNEGTHNLGDWPVDWESNGPYTAAPMLPYTQPPPITWPASQPLQSVKEAQTAVSAAVAASNPAANQKLASFKKRDQHYPNGRIGRRGDRIGPQQRTMTRSKQNLDPYARRFIRGATAARNDNHRITTTINHSGSSVGSGHVTGRDLLRKQSFRINPQQSGFVRWPNAVTPPTRKHPVQLLCELYGKNGLQIECEFLNQPPFRKQKVTYTLLGRKFTAVSHTRDEAKRLCARRALLTLHPDLCDQLQEHVPRQEYDFGYRLNRRHPVDLVNYFFKSEPVLIETEKRGLSHFTTYTVSYMLRGRRYVATAEKQNEAKRRCAILVLNDMWRSNWQANAY